jgi:hypothetical protein
MKHINVLLGPTLSKSFWTRSCEDTIPRPFRRVVSLLEVQREDLHLGNARGIPMQRSLAPTSIACCMASCGDVGFRHHWSLVPRSSADGWRNQPIIDAVLDSIGWRRNPR